MELADRRAAADDAGRSRLAPRQELHLGVRPRHRDEARSPLRFDDGSQRKRDKSVLDLVKSDLADLQGGLGAADRARLEEYLSHVREVERRIQRTEQQAASELAIPTAPVGVPESFEEHVALLYDLLALAYETDLTRVFTFMTAREVSQRTNGSPDPSGITGVSE